VLSARRIRPVLANRRLRGDNSAYFCGLSRPTVHFVTQTGNEIAHPRLKPAEKRRFGAVEPRGLIQREKANNSLFCNKLLVKTGVAVYGLSL